MKTTKLLTVLICLLICFSSLPFETVANAKTSEKTAHEFVNELFDFSARNSPITSSSLPEPLCRLIVKTETNAPLNNTFGAIDVLEGYDGIHILQYETEEDTQAALSLFKNENIEYVEKDYILISSDDSAKTCYCEHNESNLLNLCKCTEGFEGWCDCHDNTSPNHLSYNSSVVMVDEAFAFLSSQNIDVKPVNVAVIDTGLDITHELFDSSRIIIDENYQFNYSGTIYPSTEDYCKHGTFVSSVVYDNTMENVNILPYRIFAKSKNILEYSVFSAVLEAVIAYDEEYNIDVINMSINALPYQTETQNNWLNSLIQKAVENNIVIVNSAGNKKTDTSNYIPSRFKNTIVVSATKQDNTVDKSYSNNGENVDVAAPGTNIYGAIPYSLGKVNDEGDEIYINYRRDNGTSYAAPLVAAAVAMVKSVNPDLTPAEIERLIKETAYVPENWDTNYGEGIINFYNMAVAAVSEKPEIKITSDGKIEIIAPEGSDPKIYYSLDGSVPTLENKLDYTGPISFSDLNSSKIIAVCHENGKLISEPVVYKLTQYFDLTVERFRTDCPLSGGENMNITWRSFDPDIAKVDQNGNITGVSVGETQVYATFDSGLRITYVVTVEPPWWQQLIHLLFFGFIWYRI